MDIISAYQQVGTYRGAAAMCGVNHKTVKRTTQCREGRPGAVARPGRPADRRPQRRLTPPGANGGYRVGRVRSE